LSYSPTWRAYGSKGGLGGARVVVRQPTAAKAVREGDEAVLFREHAVHRDASRGGVDVEYPCRCTELLTERRDGGQVYGMQRTILQA